MKTLEKGQDTIKRICDELKSETIEPAKKEAQAIITAAEAQAEQILIEARKQAKKYLEEARNAVEQERNVFNSALEQASKQSVEALKQTIEKSLFNENIDAQLKIETSSPKIVAQLVTAIVSDLAKEGLSKDFTLSIPKKCTAEQIAKELTAETLEKLKSHPIAIGNFNGGVEVKLHDKKLTLAITEKEIAEYLKQYVRKDFRKFIFSS